MNLLTFKLLAAVAIIAVALIGGMIPIMARRKRDSRRFFSLAGGFASGVFLGAGLIHLLPDGLEKLRSVSSYPVGGLLAAVGIALLFLLDRVVSRHRVGHATASGTRRIETRTTASPSRQLETQAPANRSGVSAYVLTIILSLHSTIAGITLGLEPEVATSVAILLAILFHKGSETFALMVNLHDKGVSGGRQKLVLGLFVLMTPLGLLIGTLTATNLSGVTATVMEGAFETLAAGTFMYVAVVDIIGEGLYFDGDKRAELSLVATGIAFMALLALWT